MLGKVALLKGNYTRITLEGEEVKRVLSGLRSQHMRLFFWCLKDAEAILKKAEQIAGYEEADPKLKFLALIKIATALFNKQAIKAFTVLREKLDQKVFECKNDEGA